MKVEHGEFVMEEVRGQPGDVCIYLRDDWGREEECQSCDRTGQWVMSREVLLAFAEAVK